MKIISEDLVKDSKNTNSIFNTNKYVLLEDAELEVQNLAIEFAEWLDKYFYSVGDNFKPDWTKKQLFEIFIEQRNK